MSDKSYYHGVRTEIFPHIPQGIKRTLDVGCASGTFSNTVKQMRDAETWGIEMVDTCIDEAKTKMHRVLHGTFDDVYDELPKTYFDCIFFNDVLEHMLHPEECLIKVKDNISQGGYIMASIPNIRHISIIRSLVLKGEWKYEDSGILDKTHLRFFTRKSIVRMLEDCGYRVEMIKGIRGVGKFSITSLANVITFGLLSEFKYKQFLILAKPL